MHHRGFAMGSSRTGKNRALIWGGGLVLVAGLAAIAWMKFGPPAGEEWSLKDFMKKSGLAKSEAAKIDKLPGVSLVKDLPDTIELPAEVVKKLGVAVTPVQTASRPRNLELDVTLYYDTDRLQEIHSYFSGEIVEIGKAPGVTEDPDTIETRPRQLSYGDHVTKGQLLAVVYSVDLGTKKNELIDALARLRPDEEQYKALEELAGGATDSMLRGARANVEKDRNDVRKAEQTLRTYRVTEDEIEAVRQEARRLFENKEKLSPEKLKNWARHEIRSHLDGTILEVNVHPGRLVDSSLPLFRIADLNTLIVYANARENDLPLLQTLTTDQRRWKIQLQNDPKAKPLPGRIDTIGYVIDPQQHTAPIRGRVSNADHRLRVGQFVTATISLPPPPDEVAVPTSVIVDDGNEEILFVQPDPNKPQYSKRLVAVTRREKDFVYLRSKIRPDEQKNGITCPLPNELVVTAGAIEMQAALDELKSSEKR
jgi:cobalt-zinc-cadmium efflux system membrane fusion protein